MKELVFTGLMDLATQDTTEVKALRSRLQPAGIYLVTFDDVGMTERETDDPEATPMVNLRFKGTIDYYEPLDANDDTPDGTESDMVGKAFNQFSTLWLDDVPQAIGLLKGMYERAALPTAGQLGGVEGTEGWVDGLVGMRVGIRVRHATTNNGDKRAYYDWLSPKECQKAGIEWEDVGRPAFLPDGTEMEDPYAKPSKK
jgi:hypothetical protein